MKRRTFLSLASVTPVAAPSAWARDTHAEIEHARTAWAETVVRRSSGTFVSTEGDLRLDVSLITSKDDVTEDIEEEDHGPVSIYSFRGEKLPRYLLPTDGIIKEFQFTWKGREISVPKRFWNDFGGCLIDTTPLRQEQVPEELHREFGEFLNGLEGPKVILSADGGTALIEWNIIDTGACCGHRAIIRWIIGQSGTVIRHRHVTPGTC